MKSMSHKGKMSGLYNHVYVTLMREEAVSAKVQRDLCSKIFL